MTAVHAKPRVALVLWLILLAGGWAAMPSPAAGAEDSSAVLADDLNEKAVMITVKFRGNRPAEYGTGVTLCQEDDRAWILTANHVFAGKSEEPWKQLRLSQIDHATISFYRNSPPPIEGDNAFLRKEVSFYTFKPEDLLLLSVPLTQKLPSTAALSPPPSDADEQNIQAAGYWKDRGLTWEQVAGELAASRAGSAKFLYHTGEVHEGFSGGPVFNALGELIGINIQRVPGEQTPDGEPGAWYGKAQTINNQEVLAVIDKWMPAKCLESASQLSELAFFVYKKAMRAISIRRWAKAEELMRQAIAQKPQEGGSVHLEGMRFTEYLPRFHLGLALFAQRRYSDAIREWDQSESQGVIQLNKRYQELKKKRVRAYTELRRQAQKAAAADRQMPGPEAAAAAGQPAVEKEEPEQESAEQPAPEPASLEQAAADSPATAPVVAEPTAVEQVTGRQAPAEPPTLGQAAAEAAPEPAVPEQPAPVPPKPGEGEMLERLHTHRVATTARPCLNLRQAPSIGSTRLDCLEPGSAVTRLGQDGGWSLVRLDDGRLGWMSSARLEAIERKVGGEPARDGASA